MINAFEDRLSSVIVDRVSSISWIESTASTRTSCEQFKIAILLTNITRTQVLIYRKWYMNYKHTHTKREGTDKFVFNWKTARLSNVPQLFESMNAYNLSKIKSTKINAQQFTNPNCNHCANVFAKQINITRALLCSIARVTHINLTSYKSTSDEYLSIKIIKTLKSRIKQIAKQTLSSCIHTITHINDSE